MYYDSVIVNQLLSKPLFEEDDEENTGIDSNTLVNDFYGHTNTNNISHEKTHSNYVYYFYAALHTYNMTGMWGEPTMLNKNKIKEINSKELDYFTQNYIVLKEKYANKWIAIVNNEIVGVGDSLREAKAQALKTGYSKPVFTRVVPEGWEK